MRIFSVYFWHSEGWTPRNEALLEKVLKRARTTRHPWLIACDANMCPEDFGSKGRRCMWWPRKEYPRAGQKDRKTCGLKERMTIVANGSLKGKTLHMEVVEDFESRPHKAVSLVVRR